MLALYLLSDVEFSLINFDEKTQKIFDLSLNQKTRGTLSGMLREGLIEKSKIGSDPPGGSDPYRLTEK